MQIAGIQQCSVLGLLSTCLCRVMGVCVSVLFQINELICAASNLTLSFACSTLLVQRQIVACGVGLQFKKFEAKGKR